MDPTNNPTPAAPVNEPLVEFVRTQRQNAGTILAILSVLFLGTTAFLYYQSTVGPSSAEKKSNIEKMNEPEAPEAKLEAINPKHTDYLLGAILRCSPASAPGLALWLIGGLPPAVEAAQRTTARIQILATGGVLGMLLMMAGRSTSTSGSIAWAMPSTRGRPRS